MKSLTLALTLVVLAAGTSVAQGFGMPLWNSPKGGTGITLNADLAMPSDDYGSGTAFGARASFGLGMLTLGAGYTSWTPDEDGAESFSSLSGTGEFRIIGGSLMPVALNMQLGIAHVGEANLNPAANRVTFGGGLSAALPTPGIAIEPYLSVSNRWTMFEDLDVESNLGWTLGVNVNFGMFGAHLAYDSEKSDDISRNVFGIGAHVALRAPAGL